METKSDTKSIEEIVDTHTPALVAYLYWSRRTATENKKPPTDAIHDPPEPRSMIHTLLLPLLSKLEACVSVTFLGELTLFRYNAEKILALLANQVVDNLPPPLHSGLISKNLVTAVSKWRAEFVSRAKVFRTEIERIQTKVEESLALVKTYSKCWHCNTPALKRCPQCAYGVYCDRECQMADRPMHVILHNNYKRHLAVIQVLQTELASDFSIRYGMLIVVSKLDENEDGGKYVAELSTKVAQKTIPSDAVATVCNLICGHMILSQFVDNAHEMKTKGKITRPDPQWAVRQILGVLLAHDKHRQRRIKDFLQQSWQDELQMFKAFESAPKDKSSAEHAQMMTSLAHMANSRMEQIPKLPGSEWELIKSVLLCSPTRAFTILERVLEILEIPLCLGRHLEDAKRFLKPDQEELDVLRILTGFSTGKTPSWRAICPGTAQVCTRKIRNALRATMKTSQNKMKEIFYDLTWDQTGYQALLLRTFRVTDSANNVLTNYKLLPGFYEAAQAIRDIDQYTRAFVARKIQESWQSVDDLANELSQVFDDEQWPDLTSLEIKALEETTSLTYSPIYEAKSDGESSSGFLQAILQKATSAMAEVSDAFTRIRQYKLLFELQSAAPADLWTSGVVGLVFEYLETWAPPHPFRITASQLVARDLAKALDMMNPDLLRLVQRKYRDGDTVKVEFCNPGQCHALAHRSSYVFVLEELFQSILGECGPSLDRMSSSFRFASLQSNPMGTFKMIWCRGGDCRDSGPLCVRVSVSFSEDERVPAYAYKVNVPEEFSEVE